MKKEINRYIENFPKYVTVILIIVNVVFIINKNFLNIDLINSKYDQYVNCVLNTIFNEDNNDTLVNLIATITGFIITIISVFGVGYSKATIALNSSGVDNKFSHISKRIIYVSTTLLGIFIFIYNITSYENIKIILFIMLIYTFCEFIVFEIIVFKMFEYNISQSNSEYMQTEKQNNEIIQLLKKIAGEENQYDKDYDIIKKLNQEAREKVKDI